MRMCNEQALAYFMTLSGDMYRMTGENEKSSTYEIRFKAMSTRLRSKFSTMTFGDVGMFISPTYLRIIFPVAH